MGPETVGRSKIVPQMDRFFARMKQFTTVELFKIVSTAERATLTQPRAGLANMFAMKVGKHDSEQRPARLLSRWRAEKHQPVHPVKESRYLIARNIAYHRIIPKAIGPRKQAVYARIWGATQNSWLIEHGRYKNPARRYTGWNLERIFYTRAKSKIGLSLVEELRRGFDRALKRMASQAKKSAA